VQRTSIEETPHFNDLFHKIIYNNYSLVLINQRCDLQNQVHQRTESLSYLNNASYKLFAFCKLCLKDELLRTRMSPEEIDVLETICANWKDLIQQGNSFLTYDYAEVIIDTLKENGYPFLEKLTQEKYKVVQTAFITIPEGSKRFLRWNNYTRFEELPYLVEGFFELLYRSPSLFRYVERVEIAKEDFELKLATDNNDFPSFSIFFDKDLVNSPYHPVVSQLTAAAQDLLASTTPREISPEYSSPLCRNTTLSQGFRNYKKFLNLVGCLDAVYDPGTNYAFARP
jgi:hypothetical protein